MLSFESNTTFRLSLDVIGHAADTLEVRGMTKEGLFKFSQTIVGSGAIETFNFSVPDVPIFVSVGVAPAANSTLLAHATLYLTANSDRIGILAQGIVNQLFGVAWPHQLQSNREQSEGSLVEVSPANPAVGEDIEITVPTNECWEVCAFGFGLTTAAVVASRTVSVRFGLGLGWQISRTAGTAQTISQSVNYWGVLGGTNALIAAGSLQEIGLPQRILLPPGWQIKTVTANLDVGDQFDGITLLVRRSYRAQVTP